ncbi:hypothetical protein FRB90_012204 [Tulasnella sp. 427]|nr:hypothetical protein FRB90_012204 [Tulasnella sp. 427]
MARVSRILWETTIPLVWEKVEDALAFDNLLKAGDRRPGGNGNSLGSSSIPSFKENLVKLQSLEIVMGTLYYRTNSAIAIFPLFLAPSLTKLSILIEDLHPFKPEQPLQGLVEVVGTADLPLIRSLKLQSWGQQVLDSLALGKALRAHENLQTIETSFATYTQDTIELFKGLPMLQSLHTRLWGGARGDFPSSRSVIAKGFPRLTTLNICSGPAVLKQVLLSVKSDQMQVIKASIYPEDMAPGQRIELGTMLEGISTFTRLRQLELMPSFNLPWEVIEHTLACRNLTRFRLISTQMNWMAISRVHLDAMAEAWPCLTDLAMTYNVQPPGNGSPSIKLADLPHLTNKLPSLQTLNISFDARRAGQEEVFALLKKGQTRSSENRLESLDIGMSPKDSNSETDAQLSSLFALWWPNLKEFRMTNGRMRAWVAVGERVLTANAATLNSQE